VSDTQRRKTFRTRIKDTWNTVKNPFVKATVLVSTLALLTGCVSNSPPPPVSYDNEVVFYDSINQSDLGNDSVAVTKYELKSNFFKNDEMAKRIVDGEDYNINDPNWLVNTSDYNKETFAYKIFSAFQMLGYNSQIGYTVYPPKPPQVLLLHKFQKNYGFNESDNVTSDILIKIDELLVQREAVYTYWAKEFPLYDHMQELHPNDVSQNYVATLYSLPIEMLPNYLQIDKDELVKCISAQCNGFIRDKNGDDVFFDSGPIQQQDYYFVGAYFDAKRDNYRMPSAPVHMMAVLHEYAHYLDGFRKYKDPLKPKQGIIDTRTFNEISSYDINGSTPLPSPTGTTTTCYKFKSEDPDEFITFYALEGRGQYSCPTGTYAPCEDFAESFAYYVTAGIKFRAAANQNDIIAKKYEWLKNNVFMGMEYDTDFIGELNSGCNDVPDMESWKMQPGYISCSEDYVWDGTLKKK
jgi:hypothetical protein